MLLQHAHELGAEVYEGVRVDGVELTFGEDPVLRFSMGRKDMGLSRRLVVDASGRQTRLGTQLELETRDPVFDPYAIHTRFDGFDRAARARGAAIKPIASSSISCRYRIRGCGKSRLPTARRASASSRIFSTGVSIALKGAPFASSDVLAARRAETSSANRSMRTRRRSVVA